MAGDVHSSEWPANLAGQVSSTMLASATSRLAGPTRKISGSPTSDPLMPGYPSALLSTSARAPAATGSAVHAPRLRWPRSSLVRPVATSRHQLDTDELDDLPFAVGVLDRNRIGAAEHRGLVGRDKCAGVEIDPQFLPRIPPLGGKGDAIRPGTEMRADIAAPVVGLLEASPPTASQTMRWRPGKLLWMPYSFGTSLWVIGRISNDTAAIYLRVWVALSLNPT
jgi:hypothetical protein